MTIHPDQSGQAYLQQQGLNLYAVFDCKTLPPEIKTQILQNDIDLESYARLVLLGNGGSDFWTALQRAEIQSEHPVDDFSIQVTQHFVDTYLGETQSLLLYPSEHFVPLQQLGTLAGWSHPSPLGLGINPKYGVWFAYRTAFLTTAPLPITPVAPSSSPCDSCQDKPCITACPGQAVQGVGNFSIPACATYRVTDNSACADCCLSRMACPIGPEHRYDLEQIQYHYRYALNSIRLYVESTK